jgi:hypothetical protein
MYDDISTAFSAPVGYLAAGHDRDPGPLQCPADDPDLFFDWKTQHRQLRAEPLEQHRPAFGIVA